jgi:hypothetical protein
MKMRNVSKRLVENSEGKGPFDRTMCKWQDTIKINLKGVGCKLNSCVPG